MQKSRRVGSSEQPRELDLPSRRVEQIFASHDEIDALVPVVDRRGELIGPVAFAIAREQIAALLGGTLLLRPEPEIHEALD